MTALEANDLFAATFTPAERKYFFNHPEFKKMLASATDEALAKLNDFGVRLLLGREFTPPLNDGRPPGISSN